MSTHKDFIYETIIDARTARQFLKALFDADLHFHLDDSPRDIVKTGTNERIFSDEEADAVEKRVEEVYANWEGLSQEECPIGYLLELMGE